LLDLAVLSLRAVTVPIYTTQAVEQIRYILENSFAKLSVPSRNSNKQHGVFDNLYAR